MNIEEGGLENCTVEEYKFLLRLLYGVDWELKEAFRDTIVRLESYIKCDLRRNGCHDED